MGQPAPLAVTVASDLALEVVRGGTSCSTILSTLNRAFVIERVALV